MMIRVAFTLQKQRAERKLQESGGQATITDVCDEVLSSVWNRCETLFCFKVCEICRHPPLQVLLVEGIDSALRQWVGVEKFVNSGFPAEVPRGQHWTLALDQSFSKSGAHRQ